MGQGMWEASSLYHHQASKSEPPSYSCKKLNSTNSLNEPRSGFLPEPPDETQISCHLDFSLWDLEHSTQESLYRLRTSELRVVYMEPNKSNSPCSLQSSAEGRLALRPPGHGWLTRAKGQTERPFRIGVKKSDTASTFPRFGSHHCHWLPLSSGQVTLPVPQFPQYAFQGIMSGLNELIFIKP